MPVAPDPIDDEDDFFVNVALEDQPWPTQVGLFDDDDPWLPGENDLNSRRRTG